MTHPTIVLVERSACASTSTSSIAEKRSEGHSWLRGDDAAPGGKAEEGSPFICGLAVYTVSPTVKSVVEMIGFLEKLYH